MELTHDQLLDKIEDIEYWQEQYAGKTFMKAIRAVVELHKPSLTVETNFCNVCWAISEQHKLQVMPVIYPCATIQAIQKALQ